MTFPTLFITPEMVRDLTLIDSNVDEVRISQAIMDAQLLDFEPLVGSTLYDILVGEFDNANVSEANVALLKEAKMFLINSALLYLLDSKTVNVSAGGLNTAASTDTNTIDIKDVYIIKSSIKTKKNAYLVRLQNYIEANAESFEDTEKDGSILDGSANEIDTPLYLA